MALCLWSHVALFCPAKDVDVNVPRARRACRLPSPAIGFGKGDLGFRLNPDFANKTDKSAQTSWYIPATWIKKTNTRNRLHPVIEHPHQSAVCEI